MSLLDAEKVVDQLTTALSKQAFVQNALAEIVPKVVFGLDVMQFLIWLRQIHRRSRMSFDATIKACLKKVAPDREALDKELATKHENANESDVVSARLLVVTQFLQQ